MTRALAAKTSRYHKSTKAVMVFNALSDDLSVALFNLIADLSNEGSSAPHDKLKAGSKLTRKQFYSRMRALVDAGIVNKRKGWYSLTSFGKLVHSILLKVEKAADLWWRLKAIDQLEMSEDIPEEERAKLIEELLGGGNPEIRDELLKSRKAAARGDQPRRRRRKDQKS